MVALAVPVYARSRSGISQFDNLIVSYPASGLPPA